MEFCKGQTIVVTGLIEYSSKWNGRRGKIVGVMGLGTPLSTLYGVEMLGSGDIIYLKPINMLSNNPPLDTSKMRRWKKNNVSLFVA